MKKSLSVLTLALIAAAFAGSAQAAPADFYAGASLGKSTANDSDILKSTETAFSLVGGYQYNSYVAVELAYNDFGTVVGTGQGRSHKITGVSASVVGSYPIYRQFYVLGKLGIASTQIANPASDGGNSNRTGLNIGVGGQYDYNQRVAIRVNYDSFAIGDGSNVSKGHDSVVSAGVIYKF